MTQQSNDCQRLVRRIDEQLMPLGATVSEKAMLAESESDVRREVGVLIELSIPGIDRPTRVAVECRERDGDITRIDELVEKYEHLPVDRVIAVSRQPFTSAAAAKAQRCGIETRTLEEALAADWPGDLYDLDFTQVTHWPLVTDLRVEALPPWPDGEVPKLLTIDGFLAEMIGFRAWARKRMVQAFDLAIQQQQAAGVSDFANTGTHHFETSIERPRIMLRGADGREHRVIRITIAGTVTVEHELLRNRRYRFGKAGVTQDATDCGDGGALAVRERGEKLSIRITSASVRERK